MANEVQRFYWGSQSSPVASADIEAGTYTLTFSGDTTGSLNYNDSAATVQTALEGLASIGSGNIAVSAETNGYAYTFQGALANTDVSQITYSDGSLTLRQKADGLSYSINDGGSAPVYEVHTITLGGATTGTFDISASGVSGTVSTLDTTGVQGAYDTIFGGGVFTVTDLGGGTFEATSTSGGDYADPSISSNSTDGNPTASPYTQGSSGSQPNIAYWTNNSPTEGELRVGVEISSVWYYSSYFNYNASAGTVESAFETGTGYGCSVSGTGTSGSPWSITLDDYINVNNSSIGEGATPLRKSVSAEIVTVTEGSGGGYTLSADHGVYSLAGQSAGLRVARKLTAAHGVYSLASQSAGLAAGRRLAADAGNFSSTGQPAGLTAARRMLADAGVFSFTGQVAGLAKCYTLTADCGVFVSIGQPAGIRVSRVLAAGSGVYSLAGQDVSLRKGYVLTAGHGSYAIAGQETRLAVARVLVAEHGIFSLAGQPTELLRSYVLVAEAGVFSFAGQAAGLIASRVLVADHGAYSLTGQDVAITVAVAQIAPTYARLRLEAVRGLTGLESTAARARAESTAALFGVEAVSATARIEAPRGTKP